MDFEIKRAEHEPTQGDVRLAWKAPSFRRILAEEAELSPFNAGGDGPISHS